MTRPLAPTLRRLVLGDRDSLASAYPEAGRELRALLAAAREAVYFLPWDYSGRLRGALDKLARVSAPRAPNAGRATGNAAERGGAERSGPSASAKKSAASSAGTSRGAV